MGEGETKWRNIVGNVAEWCGREAENSDTSPTLPNKVLSLAFSSFRRWFSLEAQVGEWKTRRGGKGGG